MNPEDEPNLNKLMHRWKIDSDKSNRLYDGSRQEVQKLCFKDEESDFARAPCSDSRSPHRCFDIHKACMLDINPGGHFDSCRSGSHLDRCADFRCPTMFKCPGSFCVNVTQVCDGMNDCPNGEDEKKCENYFCPGMFRCRGENRCIWQSQVCDGVYDCVTSHDDELLCESVRYRCPQPCNCLGQAINCSGLSLTSTILNKKTGFIQENQDKLVMKINPNMRAALFSENRLNEFPPSISGLRQLYRLNLSYNQISNIPQVALNEDLRELYLHNNHIASFNGKVFRKLRYLIILTVTNNKISNLNSNPFEGLSSLPRLDLSSQELQEEVLEKVFGGLDSIEFLNISYNGIKALSKEIFINGKRQFKKLRLLDVSNNALDNVHPDVFRNLGNKVNLLTDRYKWCCFAVNVKSCLPKADEFSSCTHLIAGRTMHLFIWGMGLLSFFGNLIVLQQRIKHERETTASVMVQHLAFSDMLMGAYLLLIAGADTYYKNVFIFHTDSWRRHPVCKVAGFLYQTSSEMSLLILVVVVCDRMYAMIPGCRSHGMSLKSARGIAALGWTASAVLGVLPYLEFSYFKGSSHTETAICIMFNMSYGKHVSAWQYVLYFYIFFNLFCVTVMGFGYAFVGKWLYKGSSVWEELISDELTEEEREAELLFRSNEFIISKRLILVAVTNCTFWLPVILVTALSMLGVEIDNVTAAWITIFVVPLNSVLNPFLFSFVVNPYRSKKDQLLLNWVETELDDEDDEFAGLGEGETTAAKADETTTDGGETSMATSGATMSTTATKGFSKGIVGDVL